MWGKYRATANLDNHRQMAIYGASPEGARGLLVGLAELSTAEIETLSVTEEIIQDPRRRKIAMVMHPSYATITTTSLDQQGKPSGGDSEYKRRRRRLELWPTEEPDDLGGLD